MARLLLSPEVVGLAPLLGHCEGVGRALCLARRPLPAHCEEVGSALRLPVPCGDVGPARSPWVC